LVIIALPTTALASKKKQTPQIEKKLMEEFEKMGKQRPGIEELLKQMLDEVASNRSSLTHVEELMRELKLTADGSMKRWSPPPPTTTTATIEHIPSTTRKGGNGEITTNS
jgi:hypothetical protein